MKRLPEQLRELEIITRAQAASNVWLAERRKLLTASNFAAVCKMRPATKSSMAERLLYGRPFISAPTEYGKSNEEKAKLELAESLGVEIGECGLFVHPELQFLGATPDGVIGDDTIVEVS